MSVISVIILDILFANFLLCEFLKQKVHKPFEMDQQLPLFQFVQP